MTKRASSITIYVLAASNSPLAVVIRRGPSKRWHFLLWDRDTGMVTPGSWFQGMVYTHRCDISPRGEWMLLLAYQGANKPCAWTALCKPPSVRALQFWPQESVQTGGGFFDGRLPVLWLNYVEGAVEPENRGKTPYEFGYLDNAEQAPYCSIEEKLARDGWKRHALPVDPAPDKCVTWVKKSPRKDCELIMRFDGTSEQLLSDPTLFDSPRLNYSLRCNLKGPVVETPLRDAEWVTFNTRGELCLVHSGCLLTASASSPLDWHLVMDLNNLRPRESRRNEPAPPSISAAG
ncbi:hypothetical protein BH09SUM1_BH09SUM1_23180 [soil metagenome]